MNCGQEIRIMYRVLHESYGCIWKLLHDITDITIADYRMINLDSWWLTQVEWGFSLWVCRCAQYWCNETVFNDLFYHRVLRRIAFCSRPFLFCSRVLGFARILPRGHGGATGATISDQACFTIDYRSTSLFMVHPGERDHCCDSIISEST